MIEIKNLSKQIINGNYRISADINFGDLNVSFTEHKIWFESPMESGDILSDKNYNAFFLVPLYLSMYYKTDLYIRGSLSERLYKNMMDYGQQIFCNFSKDLSKIHVYVDELISDSQFSGKLIGTGLSCGVDSLYTIYKRYVLEKSPDYKVNSLFIFNCGTHGDFENETTYKTFMNRYKMNKKAADELGLPLFRINSNLHAFTHMIGEQKMGYIALHSCILSLQKVLSKYYMANGTNYDEMLKTWEHHYDFDFGGFCDPYFIPLVKTEAVELILEGAQFYRSEKIKIISKWNISKKYLNVCTAPLPDGRNCCSCPKCIRTLIPLNALGELGNYSESFDIEKYKKHEKDALYNMMIEVKKGDRLFAFDNMKFCIEHNVWLPNSTEVFFYRVIKKIDRIYKRIKDMR